MAAGGAVLGGHALRKRVRAPCHAHAIVHKSAGVQQQARLR